MEMYADEDSRGGILEPAGIVDVKFKKQMLVKLINRCEADGWAANGEEAKFMQKYLTM